MDVLRKLILEKLNKEALPPLTPLEANKLLHKRKKYSLTTKDGWTYLMDGEMGSKFEEMFTVACPPNVDPEGDDFPNGCFYPNDPENINSRSTWYVV